MANCNSCGKYIAPTENVYRREIYSGQSQRISYGKRITVGKSNYYSVKNVCQECAQEIDESRERSSRNMKIFLLLVLIIALVYYLVHR